MIFHFWVSARSRCRKIASRRSSRLPAVVAANAEETALFELVHEVFRIVDEPELAALA